MKRFAILLLFCVLALASLTVLNVQATTYTYTFHGPYYFDGAVADANITVTMYWAGASPTTFSMYANGVTANDTIITNSVPAVEMKWNSSSTLNYTSVYDFLSGTTDEVNLYIPSPNDPSAEYSFAITDLGANMVNPYIQISTTPDGVNSYIAQRRNLNSSDTVTFGLTQYRPYTISIICDQGTYTQSFFAENVYSTNIPVLAGAFPLTNATTLPTLEASRLNSTMIGLVYSDSSNSTDWLYYTITHQSGSSTITDYVGNTTGSSQTILWNEGDVYFSYMVNANASISGSIFVWKIGVGTAALANPWSGAFDWLGDDTPTLPHYLVGWPNGMNSAQIAQLVGVGVIMLFLGIGSYKSAGASCIIAWCAGGVMMAMGWFNGGAAQAGASSIPLFAFGGFLALLIHFQEKKSEGGGLT